MKKSLCALLSALAVVALTLVVSACTLNSEGLFTGTGGDAGVGGEGTGGTGGDAGAGGDTGTGGTGTGGTAGQGGSGGTGGEGGTCVPTAETCDGLDNDCNGETDETFTDLWDECQNGLGECAVTGTIVCKDNGSGTECDAVPGQANPETCDTKDNDCDGTPDNGCEQIAVADDSCYKAVLIVGGQVVGGTDNNTSCSSGPFAATWAPGEILQVWENDANFTFTSPSAPASIEYQCSPSNTPPDWPGSLAQSQLSNYQSVVPVVVGNDYTLTLVGCTRYLIRITR